MFVQVLQGRVQDAAAVRHALDRWMRELAPSAEGWLGSTAGVADDGTFVAVVRFASAEEARRNSDRPEQGEWWEEAEQHFTGPVRFHDCSTVALARGGGADDARFVQVIQGRTTDPQGLREMGERFEHQFGDLRPDLIGFLVAFHDDEPGAFTEVAYFTSEEEARRGEHEPPPEDAREALEAEMAMMQDLTYLDLRDPWLHSPR